MGICVGAHRHTHSHNGYSQHPHARIRALLSCWLLHGNHTLSPYPSYSSTPLSHPVTDSDTSLGVLPRHSVPFPLQAMFSSLCMCSPLGSLAKAQRAVPTLSGARQVPKSHSHTASCLVAQMPMPQSGALPAHLRGPLHPFKPTLSLPPHTFLPPEPPS